MLNLLNCSSYNLFIQIQSLCHLIINCILSVINRILFIYFTIRRNDFLNLIIFIVLKCIELVIDRLCLIISSFKLFVKAWLKITLLLHIWIFKPHECICHIFKLKLRLILKRLHRRIIQAQGVDFIIMPNGVLSTLSS